MVLMKMSESGLRTGPVNVLWKIYRIELAILMDINQFTIDGIYDLTTKARRAVVGRNTQQLDKGTGSSYCIQN